MYIINKTNHRGFTLVETIVTIGIYTILLFGITFLFRNIFVTSNQQSLALSNADQGRLAVANFTNELRNSSYGADGSYPLNQAGDSQIILFTMYGSTSSTTAIRVRYYLSGTTLYKGTIIPTGTPFSYNSASEKSVTVENDVQNGSTPLFYYYDGNYSGTSTPYTQPINLNLVKFIRMNIVSLQQDVRNATTSFTIAGGGALRNLKTNLGN